MLFRSTKSIRLLEEELGVPLLKKSGRNIVLTEYGQMLKEKLENVFPIVDAIPEEIERIKNENKLTISLNVLAASITIMEKVVKYKNKHPNVVFKLIQNEMNPDCDINIYTTNHGGSKRSGSASAFTLTENIFLAVPKNSDYAKNDDINLSEVKDEKFVYLSGHRRFKSICDGFCSIAGFKPQIGFTSDSPYAVKDFIGVEAGVGFWPEFSWGSINIKGVKLLAIKTPECKRDLVIELQNRHKISTCAKNFYEFLVAEFKENVKEIEYKKARC